MAEPENTDYLSEDLDELLDPRSKYRLAIAQAYAKELIDQVNHVEEEPVANVYVTPYSKEIEFNDRFAAIPTTPYSEDTPDNSGGLFDEDSLTEDGWPSTKRSESAFVGRVKNAFAEDQAILTAEEAIRNLLGVNFLEAFRKTYLSSKQRKRQLIRHLQQHLIGEDQSQDELERLLNAQKIGQTLSG